MVIMTQGNYYYPVMLNEQTYDCVEANILNAPYAPTTEEISGLIKYTPLSTFA